MAQKNNYFRYELNSNTSHGGDFRLYQAKNGSIQMLMGRNNTTLTSQQIADLGIESTFYDMHEFDQDAYLKYYAATPIETLFAAMMEGKTIEPIGEALSECNGVVGELNEIECPSDQNKWIIDKISCDGTLWLYHIWAEEYVYEIFAQDVKIVGELKNE